MTIEISNKTILNNAGKQFCVYGKPTSEIKYTFKPIQNQKLSIGGEFVVKTAIFDYLLINGVMETIDSNQPQENGIRVSKLAVHGSVTFRNKELNINDLYSTGGITIINCTGIIDNLQCSGSIYIENSNLQVNKLYNGGGAQISGNVKIKNALSNSLTISGNARIENIQSSSYLEVTGSSFIKNINVHSGGFKYNSDYITEIPVINLHNGGGEYSGKIPNVNIALENFALEFKDSIVNSIKSKGESAGLIFRNNNEIGSICSENPVSVYNNSTNNIKSGTVAKLEILEDEYSDNSFDSTPIIVNEQFSIGEFPEINHVYIESIIVDYNQEKYFFES